MPRKVNAKKVKLAIFDIDGTVFRSSLTIELMNQFVADKIFPRAVLREIATDYLAWRNRQGSYEDYLKQVIKLYIKNIPGCSASRAQRAIKKVIASQKDQVYRYTRDLIKQLHREGYYLVAVSGSPVEIVEPFAKYFQFNAYMGRIFEVVRGRYTGKVLNNEIMSADKAQVVKSYLAGKNIAADFKKSLAVGDTETEFSLLQLVGQPIAFNPNKILAQRAKRHGWTIVVERKDVVYKVEEFRFVG